MFDSLFARGGLSLDRLRSFLAVSEAGSIAKAAVGDLSRQALMSRQIRELEEFFGAELTVRQGKTLAISSAGVRLANLIRGQFQDLCDFQLEQENQAKAFCIGAGASILEWVMIPAAAKIRRALRDATLRFSSLRSRELIDGIRDGRLDFAIVREDAIPNGLPRLPILRVQFFICVSRSLFGSKPRSALENPEILKSLPFAANAGGGQLDQTFRRAMTEFCGTFRPAYECDSLLQVRELIVKGVCAGLLPTIGAQSLGAHEVTMREFGPLKDYGRHLALHWNERQMRRRGVADTTMAEIAKALASSRPTKLIVA